MLEILFTVIHLRNSQRNLYHQELCTARSTPNVIGVSVTKLGSVRRRDEIREREEEGNFISKI
jgi:hypothetical protein